MTYREWMTLGMERLQAAGIEEASLDAWYLLERASGISRFRYYLVQKDPFPEEAAEKFQKLLLAERARRVPLQQILGDTEFMGLTFPGKPDVCWRPGRIRELLAEQALKESAVPDGPGRRLLDVCTGSGCLAVGLAGAGKPASGHRRWIFPAAALAGGEGAERGEESVQRFHFIKGDLFQEPCRLENL